MAHGFRKTRKGIVGRFEAPEVQLLQKLFSDVAETLEPEARPDEDPLAAMVGIDQDVSEPTDPALKRLLPVASSDPEHAEEFRRLTDRSLREAKIGALKASSLALESDPVTLTVEQAQDFARSLTTSGWCWPHGWRSPLRRKPNGSVRKLISVRSRTSTITWRWSTTSCRGCRSRS